jgi:hypothetical protein
VGVIRGSTAIAGFVVALGVVVGAFAVVVVDRDDGVVLLLACVAAVLVLISPALVLLFLNVWRGEREPYSQR